MRSVPAGSFERLSSPIGLWRAWLAYSGGKRRWPAVARFAIDADAHVLSLHDALRDGTYRPARYRQHVIRDPKVRLISAPALRDRVLHQAVVAELAPHYERGYIHDSYACRTGRGPQRAVLRYLAWTRRHAWRLSLDVRRYFLSIEHRRLQTLAFRRLRDLRTRRLLGQLIAHGGGVYRTELAMEALGLRDDPVPAGTGMPVGSCLSQWCANLYLDGLDQYVKRQLGVRAYLRYMDDMTLFGQDADFLARARDAIAAWLARERGLELNPKRWHVTGCDRASTYLGYRVSRSGLTPGRKLRRRMRRKVAEAAARDPEALRATLESYRALVLFG